MKSLAQSISDRKYAAVAEYERTSKTYTRNLVPAAPPALTILDVGCGTGVNAKKLKDMGHDVKGIDISQVAIEKFRTNGFEGKQCDILDGIPYEDGSFDLVFASEVIEHVTDTAHFVAEMLRVLRPGGLLVLSTPNSAFWVYRVYALLGRTLSEVQHPGHLRFFSVRGLRQLLTEGGFRSVSLAARHMYVVLPEELVKPLVPLLNVFRFRREFRFRTNTYVWHVSRCSRRASPFWSDSLIATAIKPNPGKVAP